MRQSYFKTVLLSLATAFAALSASAVEKPTFWVPNSNGTPLWTGMSDNGLWGVANIAPSEDGSINPVGATIFDVRNRKTIAVKPEYYSCDLRDITDDGKIAVGNVEGTPAFYNVDTKKWTKLPGVGKATPQHKWDGGVILKVTPDGKYAVGYSQPDTGNEWGDFYGAMWDLEKCEIVPLGENAPYLDTNGDDPRATKISSVSPDGRWLVFETSWFQGGGWSAVYDRIEDKVYPLGLQMNPDGTLSRDDSGFVGASEPQMSNNGKYITGNTQTIQNMGDYDNTKDFTFLYDIEKHEMKVYSGANDDDILATMVLDDGTVVGALPAMYPSREAVVRYGNYFYPLPDIYKQAYGIRNLEAETNGVGVVTGTPLFASSDGKTWLIMATAQLHDCYLVTFPETIEEACSRVNLLSDYTITPASGSTFTQLSVVNIQFSRPIGFKGSSRQIRLFDEEGNAVAQAQSVSVAEETRLTFNFRPTTLEPGKKYTIELPEGIIIMDGDAEMKAPAIKIEYTGRRDGAVALTKVTPPDGTVMAEFSMGVSPITLTFDSDVAINEATYGALYRTGSDDPVTNVLLLANGTQVIVYPALAQHFFKGYDYTIVIPEGSITDLSGQGASEKITLHYTGSYVNTGSDDDKFIWRETFGDGGYAGMLFYEGDYLNPDDVPYSWGFDAETTPWVFLRDNENSNDWCIASHSMYLPEGKSDDWFTSTQLYIPDKNCFLRLEAQSYLMNKEDHLKIYVLATDDIYQYADKAYIDRFKKDGVLLADLTLSPGATQEGLEGEWEEYTFPLAQFAEKNIYIGFCNDNEDQSAIFVENVAVERDLSFFTSFTHEQYVENKESILIKPVVTIGSALNEFVALDAVLLDSEKKQIDSYSLKGQSLKEGDVVDVKFTKELPLKKGIVNDYTVQISLNAKTGKVETGNILGSVYNMTFTPKKHIVVEEFSGTQCANCPLGIVAMEHLEKTFGDAIIPIVLRCYEGDPTGATVQNYSNFLGFSYAPAARLNRGEFSSPMVNVNGDYQFSGAQYGQPVWFDDVQDEMKVTPLIEVKGEAKYNKDDLAIIDFRIRAAVELKEQSIGLFAVLLQDKMKLSQQNNVYMVNDPDLLPWSAGGKYASNAVRAEFNDIARAAFGETFYGDLGSIPADLNTKDVYKARVKGTIPPIDGLKIEDCKMALMAINTATGRIIDACVSEMTFTNDSAVETIGSSVAIVKAIDGNISISGVDGDFTAVAYGLDGAILNSVKANGSASIAVPSGLVIVRIQNADKAEIHKVIVR